MVLGQGAFNPTEKLYINNDGRVISIDEMNSLSDANVVNCEMFELQGKLQKLALKEDENCILAALSVMATGVLIKLILLLLIFRTPSTY